MSARRIFVSAFVTFSVAACGPQAGPSAAGGTWVGTIATEGELTTVVNESGSVWGGVGTLVEEASIGTAEGDDEYMLGLVRAVAASDDGIYVLDSSTKTVRSYTYAGEYVGDVGRRGEGPGEYTQPMGLAIAPDGRLFVHDAGRRRVSIYSSHGVFLDSYFLPYDGLAQLVVSRASVVYGPILVDPAEPYARMARGMLAHGPDGAVGSPIVPRRVELEVPHFSGGRGMAVPHAPAFVWAMDAWLNVISGVGRTYSFEIARADGSRTVVRSYHDPVPVTADERDALIDETTEFMRRRYGESWAWDGPEIPSVKPAFVRFMPTQSGEIWVVRPGPSDRVERADGTVRWRDTHNIDVFDPGGRLLGKVKVPVASATWLRLYATGEGGPFAFVRGSTVVLPVEDEAGTILVKRFRLVLPGE